MVALIYNTFMVYIPTTNEKEEGLLPEPVMCTTTRLDKPNTDMCAPPSG